ncbi:hypothetical protein AURUGA1_00979 [Aurantimicrobium sp. MWH-Uga1]|nr:hypothetical protein AURUGA1_00979 [Aurantimicrobium sp. MWH-Uga1]
MSKSTGGNAVSFGTFPEGVSPAVPILRGAVIRRVWPIFPAIVIFSLTSPHGKTEGR